MKTSHLLVVLCAGLLAGCGAGSGAGLNDQGLPDNNNGPDEPPEASTLAQLQEDIFSPICSQCHIGAGAPQGLRLDSEQNSFDSLVEQPSGQQPDVLRVAPGEPDQSYLVRKLAGDSSIDGGQMPLGMTPLSAEQQAQVRDWIENGAAREGTGINPTTLAVQTTATENDRQVFRLHFSRPVAPDTLDDGVQLYLRNGDQRWLAQADQYEVSLDSPQDLSVQLNPTDIPVTGVELIANDPAAATLLDQDLRVLDGDRDRTEGGVYRHDLTF